MIAHTAANEDRSEASSQRAAMNKGMAVGALGTLLAAVVISAAAYFAFTREAPDVQANRAGTPMAVIDGQAAGTSGTTASGFNGANGTNNVTAADAGMASTQPGKLPPPVYQPAPPSRQTAQAPTAVPQAPAAVPAARQAPTHAAVAGKPGVIASVREVTVKGEANGVGAAVGGVLGGVLGNQFGRGGGRTAMTVAGAVGGGLAGHEVQKRMNASKVYNVTVRFDDGTSETLHESTPGRWRQGDRVRLRNGVLVADNG